MRLGIDGRKIPLARKRGAIDSFDHARSLGMAGLFFRTVLDMTPTLDLGFLRAVRQRADELGMYLETGLGKVNPYATPEAPELRSVGDGDIVLGFRRMMEACAEIGCCELWIGTASSKGVYPGRWACDRFRTDTSWIEQLDATEKFLAKLTPIAIDLGIHMNIETHEEITSFEIVRLIEKLGDRGLGVVYDSSNGLQRLEHPVMAARRVAPFVRQTHFKDAALVMQGNAAIMQHRPCGAGVIDFEEVMAVLYEANPDMNLTIECEEPAEGAPKPYSQRRLDISDQSWLDAHPDLSVSEYVAYLEMMRAYQTRIDDGAAIGIQKGDRRFGYDEAVADIAASAAHLHSIGVRLGILAEA